MKQRLTLTLTAFFAVCTIAGTPVYAASASAAPAAGTVATSYTGLNIRLSNSTSAPIVASLPKGSPVTLISKTGDWWQVQYGNGAYGYCSASYIEETRGSYRADVNTSVSNLNVRSGPGDSYSIQDKLSKGSSIVVLSKSGSWSKILYEGTKTGYVLDSYLKAAGSSSSAPSSAPVSLSVLGYKQTDPKWANVILGSSGQTLGRIGCTTTALAITESYRLGTPITPAQMSKKLSYTPGGALYWPDNYLSITDSRDSLSTILALLNQGKPVIYGAKNASGGQHWVVVSGYNGKGLSAQNFSISDPGSNSRTNLQQFLNAYPNFHKLVYAR